MCKGDMRIGQKKNARDTQKLVTTLNASLKPHIDQSSEGESLQI